jgi:hypothetical protein
MELVLRVDKFNNQQFNSGLPGLEEMEPVEEEEAEKLKAFLGGVEQAGEIDDGILDGGLAAQRAAEEEQLRQQLEQEEEEQLQEEPEEQEPEWDKKKLGMPYKGNEDVEAVIAREMNRMRKA